MVRSFSFYVLFAAFSSSSAMAQLQSVIVEPFVIHDGSISDEYGGTLEDMTTYHVYAVCTNPSDELSSVYGDATSPLSIASTTGFYQNPLGENVAWEVNPVFFSVFPTAVYDSWVTIGVMNQNEVTSSPNSVGMAEAFSEFAAGGDLFVDTSYGSSWYTLYGDSQAQAGDDLKVLIAQLTVSNDAVITGMVNIQLFVNGIQSNAQQFEHIALNMLVEGCTLEIACNYDPNATEDDGSCAELDECGVCGGNGIQEGQCDCEGNMLDECGVCGGIGIPEGNCDCLGNTLDECGVCGGSGIADGTCDCEGNAPALGYDCNGDCLSDENENGICDYIELEAIQDDLEDGIYCGEGTIWSVDLGQCVAYNLCPKDLNGDGLIGVEDLMQLLNAFGTDCPDPNEPEPAEWTCGNPVNYHGYDYSTVQIGEQCWFGENCRYLPAVSSVEEGSEDDGLPHAYVYGWDSNNLIGAKNTSEYFSHGALYNFQAVTNWDLCPIGWSVPELEDFNELREFVGGEAVAGGKLKEVGTVEDGFGSWFEPNLGATDEFGFAAASSGGRYANSLGDEEAFGSLGYHGWYWSTTTDADMTSAWGINLQYNNAIANDDTSWLHQGWPVRCVQDSE